MISPLCPGALGPNKKAKTGLMVRNDGSEKSGMGSVGGPDKVLELPFPHPPNELTLRVEEGDGARRI